MTPALADANNGNWQTAKRWAHLLADHYRVRLVRHWGNDPATDEPADCLIALHARRSAASIAAWASVHPQRPLVVVLTGTDLYRDIDIDASAQRSLALAHRLIVLQEMGPQALPPSLHDKCHVVFQSCRSRRPLSKSATRLRALMVGHLRDEKSPQTLFDAARLIVPHEGILIDHIGAALDPALGEAARQTQALAPHYRWLGSLAHGPTRERIQRAHVLVHASRMEGGAHVVMEAVASGTPVLASDIPGNVGMLGRDYRGYFPVADAPALVQQLRRLRMDQSSGSGELADLRAQCDLRAPLFEPGAERAALLTVLAGLH